MTVYIFKRKNREKTVQEILTLIETNPPLGVLCEHSTSWCETMTGVLDEANSDIFLKPNDIIIDPECGFTELDIPLRMRFGNSVSAGEIFLNDGRKVDVIIAVFNHTSKASVEAKKLTLKKICETGSP